MENVLEITFVKHEGQNIYFILRTNEGFIGSFRIHYLNNSRANAKFENLVATDCYFEGIPILPNIFGSYKVESVTNCMLLAERKMQWLLEHVIGLEKLNN